MMRRADWLTPGFLYFVAVLALLFLPILLLIIFSFNDATNLAFPLRGFTLRHYAGLLDNREMLRALHTSILLGLGSSLISTLLGGMGAIALARFNFPGRDFFTALATLPLVIPYVILGVSLLILFNEVGLGLSAWAAGVAHVVISVPYAMLIVAARLAGFPGNLEEAAMDLGSNYWSALLRVTLPISLPALLAAFLISFTISFDEFAISNFLVGTQPTLPVYLYSQLRFPTRLPLVVALSALLMVGTMLLMVFAEWLRRLGQDP
ncbi:MAG: ABC transporter permease [bacterium]